MGIRMRALKAIKGLEQYAAKTKFKDNKELDVEQDAVEQHAKTLAAIFRAFEQAGQLNDTNFLTILRRLKTNPGQLKLFAGVLENNPELVKEIKFTSLLAISEDQWTFLERVLDAGENRKFPLNQDVFDRVILPLSKKEGINPGQLHSCLNTIYAADLHKTEFFSSKNRLQDFASKVNENNLEHVNAVLTSLARHQCLDKDSFDYVMENANNLDKSADIAKIFDNLQKTGIPVEKAYKAIIDMAKFDIDKQLSFSRVSEFNAILSNLSTVTLPQAGNRPINLGSTGIVPILLKHTREIEGKSVALKDCLQAMVNQGIPLHKSDGKNRFEKLVELNKDYLEAATSIIKNLAGTPPDESFLDGDTLDYVIENALTLKDKAAEITAAFDALRGADIPLEGLRQPIMAMNKKDLSTLTTILKEMEIGESPLKEKLDKTAVKVLIANAAKLGAAEIKDYQDGLGDGEKPDADQINSLKEQHATALGKALRQLQEQGIPLTGASTTVAQALGTERFGQDNNLNKLLSLNTAELNAVSAILESLPKGINHESTLRHLFASKEVESEQGSKVSKLADLVKTFPEDLSAELGFNNKAEIIADLFKNMHAAGVSVEGHRKDILEMPYQSALALSKLMKQMKGSTVSAVDFETLKTVIPAWTAKIAEQAQDRDEAVKQLGIAIKAVQDSGLSLTGASAIIGQKIGSKELAKDSHLARLLTLNTEQLTAVSTALEQLQAPDKVSNSVLNYLVGHAEELSKTHTFGEPPVTKTKAQLAADVFAFMQKNEIPQRGHRHRVMEMEPQDLHYFAKVLDNVENRKLDGTDFEALRSSIKGAREKFFAEAQNHPEMQTPAQLEEAIKGHCERIGKMVALIKENGHSLTGVSAYLGEKLDIDSMKKDSNLGRVLACNYSELEAVEKVLAALPKNSINEGFLDFVLENANKLTESIEIDGEIKTRADLVGGIFSKMEAAGITQRGHRQALINMPLKELDILDTALVHTDSASLDKTDFNALRKSIPLIIENFEQEELAKLEVDKLEVELVELEKRLAAQKKSESEGVIELESFGEAPLDQQVKEKQGKIEALRKGARANAENRAYDHAENLGKAIFILESNNVSLTGASAVVGELIGSSDLGEDNRITALAKLDQEQLASVTKVLNALNAQGKVDAKIVDFLVENADMLSKPAVIGPDGGVQMVLLQDNEQSTKGDLICNLLSDMNESGVEFVDRRDLMKMKVEDLISLSEVWKEIIGKRGEIDPDPAINGFINDTFKMIRDNAANFKDGGSQNLIACISALTSSGISLKNPFFGNKIDELMSKKESLPEVAKVLNALAKGDNLDASTYNNLMDRADTLSEMTGEQSKADLLVEVYDKINDSPLKLEGHRRPIMDLNCKQLKAMSNKLDQMQDQGTLTASTNLTHMIDGFKGKNRSLAEDIRYGVTSKFGGG